MAVLYQLALLRRGTARLKIRREHVAVDGSLMGAVLKLSVSATLRMLILHDELHRRHARPGWLRQRAARV